MYAVTWISLVYFICSFIEHVVGLQTITGVTYFAMCERKNFIKSRLTPYTSTYEDHYFVGPRFSTLA